MACPYYITTPFKHLRLSLAAQLPHECRQEKRYDSHGPDGDPQSCGALKELLREKIRPYTHRHNKHCSCYYNPYGSNFILSIHQFYHIVIIFS